jgi:hypothetical protein
MSIRPASTPELPVKISIQGITTAIRYKVIASSKLTGLLSALIANTPREMKNPDEL